MTGPAFRQYPRMKTGMRQTGKQRADEPRERRNPCLWGIAVTIHSACLPFGSTVQVVPSKVTLGMGCRKGKDAEAIEAAASECLKRAAVYREATECLASIDLKKDEKGLLYLAKKWKIPFVTSARRN